MKLVTVLVILMFFQKVAAYADFIGYGYNNCITCHVNSLGNGPLTDYGRALLAVEISSRWLLPKKITDEKLGENAGFVPGVDLPIWFRPFIKYRGLWIERTSPPAGVKKVHYIAMQRDFGVTLNLDKTQRTLMTATYSLLDRPKDYYNDGKAISWISREHYLRFYLSQNLLISVGLMDKAYGIRTPDHTSYSRTRLGFGQDDQSHGVLLHYFTDNWDLAAHFFIGNQSQQKDLQHKGFSLTGEYQIADKARLGGSLTQFKNATNNYRRLALHYRWGLPLVVGSSIWLELGLKEDIELAINSSRKGNYFIIHSIINLTRGYNFFSTLERLQDESGMGKAEKKKWSVGFITFPFPKIEARIYLVNAMDFSPSIASEETWTLQGQLHGSF